MTEAIVIVLLFISAAAKAVMDKLQFHYKDSVFANAKKEQWWNPKISWRNKYDWSRNRFIAWCLRTWLVSITDAWHVFGFVRDFSLFLCLPVATGNWWFLILYPVYRINFHIFFHKILNK